jgi:hypothetical protein
MTRVCTCALVAALLGLSTSPLRADYYVYQVGENDFIGFPSNGGTGSILGQQDGTATIEKDFTAIGLIPIIIVGGPSTGSETIHINERVFNHTGKDWTDFHFLVQPIDASDELVVEFANVVNPTGEWTMIEVFPGIVSLYGFVPDGGTFSLSFDLVITAPIDTYNLFGIHEFPTVPEPGTTTLALIGCSMVALRRWRRSETA